jgi:hypothetical protein
MGDFNESQNNITKAMTTFRLSTLPNVDIK